MKSFLTKAAVAFAIVTALTGQARAVAKLVSSAPEANEVATLRPQQLGLQFSEELLKVVDVTVTGRKGRLATVLRLGQFDQKQVYVTFFNPLAPGRYVVKWQVMSSDRHGSRGTYAFSVK